MTIMAVLVTWTVLLPFWTAISFLKGNQNDVIQGKYPKYQQILKEKEVLKVLMFLVNKLPKIANCLTNSLLQRQCIALYPAFDPCIYEKWKPNKPKLYSVNILM